MSKTKNKHHADLLFSTLVLIFKTVCVIVYLNEAKQEQKNYA